LLAQGEIAAVAAALQALKAGVDVDRISMSSDGNASLPEFDTQGRLAGRNVGRVGTLAEAVRGLVQADIALEHALKMVSYNAAQTLGLAQKGRVSVGMDADLVLLDRHLAVTHVWGRGRYLVADGKALVQGQFS